MALASALKAQSARRRAGLWALLFSRQSRYDGEENAVITVTEKINELT